MVHGAWFPYQWVAFDQLKPLGLVRPQREQVIRPLLVALLEFSGITFTILELASRFSVADADAFVLAINHLPLPRRVRGTGPFGAQGRYRSRTDLRCHNCPPPDFKPLSFAC